MNTQNKENNSIPFIKDGDTVKVYAETLTREIVDQLINMKDVKKIRLTGLVREIGGASFEGLDFAKTKWFDFSNANIEKVGCLAFHDCENIYFGQYFYKLKLNRLYLNFSVNYLHYFFYYYKFLLDKQYHY